MTAPRIGTVFLPGWAPELVRPVAQAAELAGLDDLWFWEDCFNAAGPSSAAVALAVTDRITVGIGLMPAPLRQVALTAMEIATLERIFPGRFAPVIGHGVQRWMAQLGVKPASPLTLLREYATALRALLAGEEVTVDGDYVRLDRVRLAHPPERSRLFIGGEGPRTLALAATHGDGTMLTSALSEERVGEAAKVVRTATGGRPHELIGHLMVFRGEGAGERMARQLSDWPPGATAVVTEAADAGAQADHVASAVDRFAALGVTRVLVHSTDQEQDPVGFVSWVGDEVAPRVTR
ncbi:MAG TPA: LLM class flavin-dependent oxidoreductase [Pseudolysinimonas sp.]|jgi:alkanesulfonate monooxygenase SsuD/methylene tetrahydromethanopterin reductase-like flavin-dependent oxidoreductase (luciferase family)|nr:LLM class flavin-dependent oxidoreductase [Pseudolysinimonas sp.]